jgi:hypothetical protein
MNEKEQRAKNLHEWYCQQLGCTLPWNMEWLRKWTEWMTFGHNGPQLKTVINYLRKEIAANRRNRGSLALVNLLNLETFSKDLSLAQMQKSGALDPDKKLSRPPDAEPVQRPRAVQFTAPYLGRQSMEDGPTPAEYAEYLKQKAELEKLKQTL